MNTFSTRVEDHLWRTLLDDSSREAAANRAILRRCVPSSRRFSFNAYRVLHPVLAGAHQERHREDCVILVAHLAAISPKLWSKASGSVGAAARPPSADDATSKSFTVRFTTLLDSTFDELQQRLPPFVRLLESKGSTASLGQLLEDLQYWNAEKKYVQRRWAREFFRTDDETETEESHDH